MCHYAKYTCLAINDNKLLADDIIIYLDIRLSKPNTSEQQTYQYRSRIRKELLANCFDP